jgi:hypothetical protein
VRALQPNLHYKTFSPTSWILCARGEGVAEFRDKVVSLGAAVLDMWVTVAMSEISLGFAYVMYKSGILRADVVIYVPWVLCIGVGFLGIFLVLLRWWTPSFVRFEGGIVWIDQPHRWGQPLRVFNVSDVMSVQTSVGNASFHSLFTYGIWLRDGTKITFLRARDMPEAKWVLNLLKEEIAEQRRQLKLHPQTVHSLNTPIASQ